MAIRLLFCYLFFTAPAAAQSIRGVVRHNNEPLVAATVVLMRADSSIVKTVRTGKGGLFVIDSVQNGRYLLNARFLGYQPYYAYIVSPSAKAIQISLLPLAQQLQGVQVQAQRPPAIEQRIDGLVYNPQGDLVAAGSNAQDLLQRVPFVTVSQEGTISIRGNNSVRVFINNKPAEFYANNVADLLRSLSADDIARVEVITHPSVRYDAEGAAGVLHIWLKKNRLRGITGAITVNANDIDQNYNVKLNYRMAKVYGTFELYQYRNRSYNNEETERIGSNGFLLHQSSENRPRGSGNFFTFNAGWEPDSTQAFDIAMRLGIFPDTRESQLHAQQFQDDVLQREYSRYTSRDNMYRNRGLTFSYNKKFSKSELYVLGGYSARNNESGYIMRQSDAYKEKNENRGHNYDLMFQSDYIHPFSSKHKIETGLKYSMKEINTDYALFNFDSLAGYEKDPARSLQYHFEQNVMAAYLSYDLSIKEWKVRLGTRYEYTWLSAQGLQLPAYGTFVPNIIISRRSFSLSYSRRIQRPEVYQLSPSMDYSDSLNITTGNPSLVPERSHRIELGYATVLSNNSSISVSVYHSYANNSIQSIRVMKGNGVIYNSYANIAGNSRTGLSLNTSFNIGKRFKLNTNANMYYVKFRSSDTIASERPYAQITFNLTYQLPKGYGLEGGFNWESRYPLVYGYVTGWRNQFLGANKKLWGERAAVSLRLQSLITNYFLGSGEFYGDGYTEKFKRNFRRPIVRIGFTYKFGRAFNTRPERARRSIEGL